MFRRDYFLALSSVIGGGCLAKSQRVVAQVEKITFINESDTRRSIRIRLARNAERVYSKVVDIPVTDDVATTVRGPWPERPGRVSVSFELVDGPDTAETVLDSNGCFGIIVEIRDRGLAIFGPTKLADNCDATVSDTIAPT